jgi:nicotinate-nucleotide adenylyltransferase
MAGLIGVFGGTFDPPHYGHLILAEEARHALHLEQVLWVVTARPPHKPRQPVTPVDVRLALVQAAIAGNPAFALSLADVERPAPHYAVGTLYWLQARHPEAGLVYLMGSDSLRDLPNWHAPREFIEACTAIAVMRRPGAEVDLVRLERLVPGLRLRVRYFDAPLLSLSAQEVRRRVHAGRSYRYLVPPAVADLIAELGLYR